MARCIVPEKSLGVAAVAAFASAGAMAGGIGPLQLAGVTVGSFSLARAWKQVMKPLRLRNSSRSTTGEPSLRVLRHRVHHRHVEVREHVTVSAHEDPVCLQ